MRSSRRLASREEPKRGRSIIDRLSNAVYGRMNAETQKKKPVKKSVEKPARKAPKVKSPRRRTTRRSMNKDIANAAPPQTSTAGDIDNMPSNKPKLRRSIVMEAFTEFFVRKSITSRKLLENESNKLTPHAGSQNLWKILFLHQDYAFFVRRFLLKINLPLTNKLVFNRDRYIVHQFFGSGLRMNPKVMEALKSTNKLPLFDTLQAKSFEDINCAWSIPTKVINANVLNLNSLKRVSDVQLNICNRYLSELRLVCSPSSCEYAMLLLTQLKTFFPSLTFVNVVYISHVSGGKKSVLPLEDQRLRKFVQDLKEDRVGIQEFSETFNTLVFQAYPVVQFKVQIIYQKENLMARQLRSSTFRRCQDSYLFFEYGLNQITGTFAHLFSKLLDYSFKYDYESLA